MKKIIIFTDTISNIETERSLLNDMKTDLIYDYMKYCNRTYKDQTNFEVFVNYVKEYLEENKITAKVFHNRVLKQYSTYFEYDFLMYNFARLMNQLFPDSLFFKLVILEDDDTLSLTERRNAVLSVFDEFKLRESKHKTHSMSTEKFTILSAIFTELNVCCDYESLKELAEIFYYRGLKDIELYWFARLYLAIEEGDDEYFNNKINEIEFNRYPGYLETLKTLYLIKNEDYFAASLEVAKIAELNPFLFRSVALRYRFGECPPIMNYSVYKTSLEPTLDESLKLGYQNVLALEIVEKNIFSDMCWVEFGDVSVSAYQAQYQFEQGTEPFALLIILAELYQFKGRMFRIQTLYDNLIGEANDIVLPEKIFDKEKFTMDMLKEKLSMLREKGLVLYKDDGENLTITENLLVLTDTYYFTEKRKFEKTDREVAIHKTKMC